MVLLNLGFETDISEVGLKIVVLLDPEPSIRTKKTQNDSLEKKVDYRNLHRMSEKRIYYKAVKAAIATCRNEQFLQISPLEFIQFVNLAIYKNRSLRRHFPIVTRGENMIHSVVLDPVPLTHTLNAVLRLNCKKVSDNEIHLHPNAPSLFHRIMQKTKRLDNANQLFTIEKVKSLLQEADQLESDFYLKFE